MRALATVVALLALSQPAFSATSLCVDSHVTGFDWVDGEWTTVNFAPTQYLIKEVQPDDPIGLSCYAGLEGEGLWSATQGPATFGTSWSCYSRAVVGQDFSMDYTSRCRKFQVSETVTGAVDCNFGGVITYDFQPSGEIVTTRTITALMPAGANGKRDSLAIAVGDCTVVVP